MAIQEDPDPAVPCTVVVSKMGWSRDYAIYKGDRMPESKEERVQQMWMWFNKTIINSNKSIIDLENFRRGLLGESKELKDKGQTLWRATFSDRPRFEYHQKLKGQQATFNPFRGFNNDGYESPDEDYYFNHRRNQSRGIGTGDFVGSIVTKWSLNTQAIITGGDTDRTKNTVGNEEMTLHVFSKGTVVTSYYENITHDPETNQRRTHTDKREVEYIDRIEYKLMFRGQPMYQWVEPGDASHDDSGTTNYSFTNPLYEVTYVGGFFKKSYVIVRTLPGCDPALAMLVAHLITTEYSNEAIKQDLKVNTPRDFPHSGFQFRMW